MKIFWDTPHGELYNFNNKSELVTFLNKTQIHFEIESFSGDPTHGISIRFVPENDDEFSDGEFAAEYIKAPHGESFYGLPIHNPNPYSTLEEQYASVVAYHYGICLVKEEDVSLDERWKFPCNVFIWVEQTHDRMGTTNINLFSVWPVGSERTVSESQKYEDEHAEKQIERLNYFIELEEADNARRNLKNNLTSDGSDGIIVES